MSSEARGSSFDELAKGVASGTISRGRAMKIAGAALLAALLGGSVATEKAWADVDRVCRNKQVVSNKSCGGNVVCSPTNFFCQCTRTVNGDVRCLDYTDNTLCPVTDECDRNRDCPRGEVCAKVGACCAGSRRNICIPLCRD